MDDRELRLAALREAAALVSDCDADGAVLVAEADVIYRWLLGEQVNRASDVRQGWLPLSKPLPAFGPGSQQGIGVGTSDLGAGVRNGIFGTGCGSVESPGAMKGTAYRCGSSKHAAADDWQAVTS